MLNNTEIVHKSSSLEDTNSSSKKHLCLVESQTNDVEDLFFDGELYFPYQTARCLRTLSNLVGARFYIPPAMLERILREADPVITVSNEVLRFEGFSSCCSCYGRLDVDASGFTSSKLSPGTTNVDFKAKMRTALAKVRPDDSMKLSVWRDKVQIVSDDELVQEDKVILPFRWVKGFAELQAQQISGRRIFSLNKVQATRFIRSLPRQKMREDVWVGKQGSSARFSSRPLKNAIKSKGLERLTLIEDLLPITDELHVYSDDASSFSTWVLKMGALTFTLCISSEPWRGFSGEGGLLESLILNSQNAIVAKLNAQLHLQQNLNLNDISQQFSVTEPSLKTALSILASQGKIGFDVHKQTFFHRVLPFSNLLIDQIHPRLAGANKLIASDAVTINGEQQSYIANVLSNGTNHRVDIKQDEQSCTCPWFAKYQETRGPCKHILAALIKIKQAKE